MKPPAPEPGHFRKNVQPMAPSAALIALIHRDNDGFVPICRSVLNGDSKPKWEQGASIQVAELDQWFPEFRDDLLADSFFGINATWRGGYGKNLWKPELEGVPRGHRSNADVRWLCAAFADLDIHKIPGFTDLSEGQALGAMVDLQAAGVIPPASVWMRSGRGLWGFWFLKADPENLRRDTAGNVMERLDGPVRNWANDRSTYQLIQVEIGRRLAKFKADAGARDLSRVTRIPGSINTKSRGRRVGYWLQGDEVTGRGYHYTLAELAERFGVQGRKTHPVLVELVDRPVDPKYAEPGKKAMAGRGTINLKRMELLRSLRTGGFPEGMRNHAGILIALWMRHAGFDKNDTLEVVCQFFRDECHQKRADGTPDTVGELEAREHVERAYRKTGKGINHFNQLVADWLDVTPTEAELIEECHPGVVPWPPATRFQAGKKPIVEGYTRSQQTAERRRFLDHLAELESWREEGHPPLRVIRERLADENLEASESTIRDDLLRRGITNPDRGWKKYRKTPKTGELDFDQGGATGG